MQHIADSSQGLCLYNFFTIPIACKSDMDKSEYEDPLSLRKNRHSFGTVVGLADPIPCVSTDPDESLAQ